MRSTSSARMSQRRCGRMGAGTPLCGSATDTLAGERVPSSRSAVSASRVAMRPSTILPWVRRSSTSLWSVASSCCTDRASSAVSTSSVLSVLLRDCHADAIICVVGAADPTFTVKTFYI